METVKFLNNTMRLKGFKHYNPKLSLLFFTLAFVGISLFYNYHKILFFKPQSAHQYRQSDCLSITKNYYYEGMDFWHPSIHNHISDNGKTGHTLGEFPILYYTVAGLWHIFGPHESVYRALVVLLCFIGLLALFKTCEHLLQDSIWAGFLSLIIFTFPIYAYYGNNFLTNLPAFNLVLVGWYFFYKFYLTEKQYFFWITAGLFLLGGLLKITALISFLVLFGIFFLEWVGFKNFGKKGKLFKKPGYQIFPFLMVFGATIAWYKYVEYFNDQHGGKYTFNSIWPIWSMDKEQIIDTINKVNIMWLSEYFSEALGILVLASVIFCLVKFNKLVPFFSYMVLTALVGGLLYLVLWFNALHDHDYYVLNLLIIPVFAFSGIALYLKQYLPRIFNSPLVKVGLILFLGYNVAYCADRMENRYWSGWNTCWGHCDLYVNDEYAEIKPQLRNHGITRQDTVISIPDVSFNISLYLMDVNGYTNMGGDNKDSASIAKNIKRGADYLVIGDSSLYKKEYIRPFTQQKILSHDNLDVYDLRPVKKAIKDARSDE